MHFISVVTSAPPQITRRSILEVGDSWVKVSPSCVLYEVVSGDSALTPGEALVIMVSAPTAAVLGPMGTLRAP